MIRYDNNLSRVYVLFVIVLSLSSTPYLIYSFHLVMRLQTFCINYHESIMFVIFAKNKEFDYLHMSAISLWYNFYHLLIKLTDFYFPLVFYWCMFYVKKLPTTTDPKYICGFSFEKIADFLLSSFSLYFKRWQNCVQQQFQEKKTFYIISRTGLCKVKIL